MFERYRQNIDPGDERFIAFISRYLLERNVNDPKAVPYSELYRVIKAGIREYLAQPQKRQSKK